MSKINFYTFGNQVADATSVVDKVRHTVAEKLVSAFDDKAEYKDEISAARVDFMRGYVATKCNISSAKAKEILDAGKGDKAINKQVVNVAMSQWSQIAKIAWPEASRRGGGRKAASTKAGPVATMSQDEFVQLFAAGNKDVAKALEWALDYPEQLVVAWKAAIKSAAPLGTRKVSAKAAPRQRKAA
jgi:hypothetical protein